MLSNYSTLILPKDSTLAGEGVSRISENRPNSALAQIELVQSATAIKPSADTSSDGSVVTKYLQPTPGVPGFSQNTCDAASLKNEVLITKSLEANRFLFRVEKKEVATRRNSAYF